MHAAMGQSCMMAQDPERDLNCRQRTSKSRIVTLIIIMIIIITRITE